jgi:plastocyanin
MPMFAPLRLLILLTLVLAATACAVSWLLAGPVLSQAGGRPEAHTIEVGDFWFCDQQFQGGVCETVIQAGDSVVWDFAGASATHSATECGASCDGPTTSPFWDSDFVSDGSTFDFSFPFDQAGTYLYRCRVHPTLMRGRIVVQGGLPTPPGPPKFLGDVNCDGDANAIDAALLLQFGAGILDDLECLQNADVNGDGRVDAIDAALVLQFVAGLLDTLPP